MTKKLFATLASLALLAGACAMPAAAEETYGYGDVTMDGSTDLIDIMAVMEHYNWETVMGASGTLTDEQKVIADLDGDGIIDTVDARLILLFYCDVMFITTEEEYLALIDEYHELLEKG